MAARWLEAMRRRPLYALLPLAAVLIAAWAFRPRPLAVEAARLQRAAVVVSFTEEGRTRVRERFVVSAPLPGVVERIELEPGDPVTAGAPVATLRATRAALLDAATRAEAQARWREAGAGVASASAALRAAQAVERERRAAFDRLGTLARQALVARGELDAARAQLATAQAETRVAAARLSAARVGEQAARRVLALQGEGDAGGAVLQLASPVTGRVLRRLTESEAAVPAGQPLLEIGDLHGLEIVSDVLTADAVRLRPGMRVVVRNWGGPQPLTATVVRVEPGAFVKVSALGVEEQRVPVVARLDRPPPPALGDAYRVDAQFVVWQATAVPSLPVAALFRDGDRWAVYAVDDGRARLRPVTTGHFGADRVEIRAGLPDGAVVVVYPGDRVRDGVRVRAVHADGTGH